MCLFCMSCHHLGVGEWERSTHIRNEEEGALLVGWGGVGRARRLLEGDDVLPVELGGGSSGKDSEKPHSLVFWVRMKAY